MKRRIAGLVALVVLLAAVVLPLALVTTAPGGRMLAMLAGTRLPLVLSGIEGSILRGLRVQRLVYAGGAKGTLRVEAQNVAVRLAPRCLLRSELCLSELQAAVLRIDLPAPRPEADDDPLAFLRVLPTIRVQSLALGRLEMTFDGATHAATRIRAAGSLGRAGIALSRVEACHELGCLEGSASLGATGAWETKASLGLKEATLVSRGLALPTRYRVEGQGDFVQLSGSIVSPEVPELGLRGTLRFAPASARGGRVVAAGIATVVPALEEQPWLQLDGPLTLDIETVPGGLRIAARQALAGYGDAPLDLAAMLERDGELWRLASATLGDPAAPRLKASGTLGTLAAPAPSLDLDFARFRPPAAATVPLAEVSGAAAVSLSIDDPLATWCVSTPRLFLRESERLWQVSGDLRASEQLLLPIGSLDATLRDAVVTAGEALPLRYRRDGTGTPARLWAPEGITAGGLALSGLQLAVEQNVDTRVTLRSEGDLDTQLHFTLRETEAGVAARVQPFHIGYAGQTVGSGEVIDLEWLRAENAFVTGALCIEWQDSRGCSDGLRIEETGSAALRLEMDETYRGQLNGNPFFASARGGGDMEASWEQWQLQAARVDLDLAEFVVDPFVGARSAAPVSWDSTRLSGRLADDTVTLDAALASERFGDLAFSVTQGGDVLSGSLATDGLAVSALSDLVPEWAVSSGLIVADLRLAGSRDSPELFGDLMLREGAMRIKAIDSVLEDVALEANFEGRVAALTARGVLGGGDLRAEGRCCEESRFTGILIGDRNRLRLPRGLDASLSPSLDIVLDAQQLAVTGSLTVHDGVFEHSALQNGGVAVSNDVRRLDAPGAPPSRFRVDLDVNTLIEPGFMLRSKQIESTLGGDLRLVMPANAPPSLFGNLAVLAGELRAYGTSLRLTEGSLGFVGDPLNPDLAINAEREIRAENQRVGFRVRGTLEEPILELFSDPQRTENETISYLIRGRAPDVGVSADGTAMALSLGATALNQSGVLAPLNSIPLLSGVTVGAEGSNEDMAATISAYVGDRLYLSYGVGIYEPINALTARLYLRSRLWLEVVSRLESSFDLYYRFDLN